MFLLNIPLNLEIFEICGINRIKHSRMWDFMINGLRSIMLSQVCLWLLGFWWIIQNIYIWAFVSSLYQQTFAATKRLLIKGMTSAFSLLRTLCMGLMNNQGLQVIFALWRHLTRSVLELCCMYNQGRMRVLMPSEAFAVSFNFLHQRAVVFFWKKINK